MTGSLQIAQVAGVSVRVHWTFLLIPIVFLYGPLINLRRDPGGPDWLILSLITLAFLIVAILLHESAHAVAARRLDGRPESIVFWGFGGLTYSSGLSDAPSTQIPLSLAGPACNFLLAALAYGAAQIVPPESVSVGPFTWRYLALLFATWNLILGVLSLVPAHPLDGGQALHSVLRARLGYGRGDAWTGRIGIAAAAAILVAGLLLGHMFLVVVALVTGASSIHLFRQGREEQLGILSPTHSPEDVRPWRLPKAELNAEIRRRRAEQQIEEQTQKKVDELLKQISEKGMNSLSRADLAFLKRASERLRQRRSGM